MTTTKGHFTNMELEVVMNFFRDAEGNGHDFGFTDAHGIGDNKVARGVIASLVKKKIIDVHESFTNESGTWRQFTWHGKEPHEVNTLSDILN